MSQPRVVAASRGFKAGLLAREATQMQQMARRWLEVEHALDANIGLLTREMAERKKAGGAISQSALNQQTRYRTLRGQTARQFDYYANYATGAIKKGQASAAGHGVTEAARQIELSYTPRVGAYFDHLPVKAVEYMVGLSAEGAPIGDLIHDRMKGGMIEGWEKLTGSLIQGTALGWNPRKTARMMKDGLTGGLQKSLVIARSEQMRVYRQASLDQYVSSGVVESQKRLAAKSGRTCAACLLDDGAIYPLNAIISDHPNGRCTSIPVLIGVAPPTWETGEDWLLKQPEDVQAQIMGGSIFDAFKRGEIDLSQLGITTYDPTWGAGLRAKTAKELGIAPTARSIVRLEETLVPTSKMPEYTGARLNSNAQIDKTGEGR